jgi:hypothetical protein
MRAQAESKPKPAAPSLKLPTQIENAADYAGIYQSPDGRKLEFAAQNSNLFLIHNQNRVPVETDAGGDLIVLHPDLNRFGLVFGRADQKDPKSAVVELGWGADWYVNSKYSGPTKFDYPKEWDSYVGHYRNESAWVGSLHVVVRKDKLLLEGVVPLEPAKGTEDNKETTGKFHLHDEENSPEWAHFTQIVNGKAMHVKFSGEDLWRVMTP